MTREVRFPDDDVTVKEFEHPDGSTGIMAGLSTSTNELAERFDLDFDGDDPVVIPFRKNTDGRTDFEQYHHDDDDIVFEMTETQFRELRFYIQASLSR